MTLVFRKQRAQDRVKGRYSFDWGEDDYPSLTKRRSLMRRRLDESTRRTPEGVKANSSAHAFRAKAGTVGGGGALPSVRPGVPPKVALIISAMPPSVPSTLVTSTGSIKTF